MSVTHCQLILCVVHFHELAVWGMFIVLVPRFVVSFPAIENFPAHKARSWIVFFVASTVVETGLCHLKTSKIQCTSEIGWEYLKTNLFHRTIVVVFVLPAFEALDADFLHELELLHQAVHNLHAFRRSDAAFVAHCYHNLLFYSPIIFTSFCLLQRGAF